MSVHAFFSSLQGLSATEALLLVLPVAASAIAVAGAIPQLALLVRSHNAKGVSIAGWATGTASNTAWVVSSYINGSPFTALALLLPALLTAAVFVLSTVWGGDRHLLATPFLFLALLGGVLAIGVPELVTVVLATTTVWAFGPSILAIFTASDLSGNAVATWVLAGGYGAIWGLYGFLLSDLAVLINGTINLVLGAAVLSGILIHRHGLIRRKSPTVTSPSQPAHELRDVGPAVDKLLGIVEEPLAAASVTSVLATVSDSRIQRTLTT
ncbi:uncharacterized protein with PQ loop repeat [Conyzicola lurida]|uniref:Uncharacterized protein with PQ loop repeat n=1 Tax=Conyzicola lurida TaxID=1172621 RepID=A0A841AJV7_9MICO|nr:hypothetical protein [Conyzicola lurida]MBB5843497.1 uncharacterized protein with PQ loop repeat [Conyzicola lurida]